MLAIQVIRAAELRIKDVDATSSVFCVVRFGGRELCRTELCSDLSEPVWQDAFTEPIETFWLREKESYRSFFLERLDFEVYTVNEKGNKADFYGIARMRLFQMGVPTWNVLVDPNNATLKSKGRVLIGLSILDDERQNLEVKGFMQVSDVFPKHVPHYRHLYIDFDRSAGPCLGSSLLACFEKGELIIDMKDNVDWDVFLGMNAFGDVNHVVCRGTLIITDIRVVFLPYEALQPPWMEAATGYISSFRGGSLDTEFTEEQLLSIRRMTYIMPIPSIQDIKVTGTAEGHVASISFTGRDGSSVEFFVRRLTASTERVKSIRRSTVPQGYYNAGIQTQEVAPLIWCNRVQDELVWLTKEGQTWIRFAKYLKVTCDALSKSWNPKYMSIAELTKPVDVEADFRRMDVGEQDNFEISTLNFVYGLCPTYPKVVCLPKTLSNDEIKLAAKQRSKKRLPCLTWIHPMTRLPICRASQPKSGMSATGDHDKAMCLALKATSATHPLRIIDARPYINAQANALRGKGYENVGFLGGPTVAALAFMDIHNIHVMRDSLAKLRDASTISNITGAGTSGIANSILGSSGNNVVITSDSVGATTTSSNNALPSDKVRGSGGHSGDVFEAINTSKWIHHTATVLRAAVTTADSILMGHPILIHCSDGWDRTAQLSGLSSILLDPYYRTIEGFFVVVEKEWIQFGHHFEDRCGRLTHKETSPVFLQFLDCVYQLIRQFPSEFEYSEKMPALMAQLCYSRLFINFAANSEKDRADIMRNASRSSLKEPDAIFASVFCYIRVLLYSNGGDRLINPYYSAPIAHKHRVRYLRPKFGVSDLSLWEDGLLPGIFWGVSKFHSRSPSMDECQSFTVGTTMRYINYIQTHMAELPESVQHTLEFMSYSHKDNLCPPLPYSRPHQVSNHEVRRWSESALAIPPGALADNTVRDCAARVIQGWYLSRSRVAKLFGGMKCKNVLIGLLVSETKLRLRRRKQLGLASIRLVQDILFDAIDDVVPTASKKEMRSVMPRRRGSQATSSADANALAAANKGGFFSKLMGMQGGDSSDDDDVDDDVSDSGEPEATASAPPPPPASGGATPNTGSFATKIFGFGAKKA